jgi:peptidoglycan/LPS O-acetylase OafA/YrhL
MEEPRTGLAFRQSGDTFRADIAGIRGVAVLLVVACHCGIPWCAGGFVGVDIFFVISGYLMTGLLAREYLLTSRIDFRAFFARRARRLLPACLLVLASTALAAALLLGPQDIEFTARAALAGSIYMSNVFFDHASSDYFAASVQRNPLLHIWSLGVEEQFYLVWPLLIIIALRWRRASPGWILGALAASSFVCGLLATREAPTFAFYELPARAWEFAAGGLLALPMAGNPCARIKNWAVAGGIVGAAMVLGTAFCVRGGDGFPGCIALIPVAGTLLTLFAGQVAQERGVSAVLGVAPLQFLGARSYSWYLWHWSLIVFASALLPAVTVGQKIAAAIAALMMAEITYRWFEHPIRKNEYLVRRPGLLLVGAAGATLLSVGASAALASFARNEAMVNQKYHAIEAASVDFGFESGKCYAEGQSLRSFETKVCVFGAPRAPRTVVLFGDSHAMQWMSAMRKVVSAEGWRLVTLVRPGCSASDINPHQLAVASDRCKIWRAQAIATIIAMQPFAVVMASYNGSTVRTDVVSSSLMPVDEIRSGTRSTLLKLNGARIPVVVLRDSPIPPFNVPACIGRTIGQAHAPVDPCRFDASGALNPAAFDAEHAAGEGLSNVYYLDMDDLICPGASCPAVQDGRIVYRDENHLAGSYAESLAGEVAARLSRVLDGAPALAHRSGD